MAALGDAQMIPVIKAGKGNGLRLQILGAKPNLVVLQRFFSGGVRHT